MTLEIREDEIYLRFEKLISVPIGEGENLKHWFILNRYLFAVSLTTNEESKMRCCAVLRQWIIPDPEINADQGYWDTRKTFDVSPALGISAILPSGDCVYMCLFGESTLKISVENREIHVEKVPLCMFNLTREYDDGILSTTGPRYTFRENDELDIPFRQRKTVANIINGSGYVCTMYCQTKNDGYPPFVWTIKPVERSRDGAPRELQVTNNVLQWGKPLLDANHILWCLSDHGVLLLIHTPTLRSIEVDTNLEVPRGARHSILAIHDSCANCMNVCIAVETGAGCIEICAARIPKQAARTLLKCNHATEHRYSEKIDKDIQYGAFHAFAKPLYTIRLNEAKARFVHTFYSPLHERPYFAYISLEETSPALRFGFKVDDGMQAVEVCADPVNVFCNNIGHYFTISALHNGSVYLKCFLDDGPRLHLGDAFVEELMPDDANCFCGPTDEALFLSRNNDEMIKSAVVERRIRLPKIQLSQVTPLFVTEKIIGFQISDAEMHVFDHENNRALGTFDLPNGKCWAVQYTVWWIAYEGRICAQDYRQKLNLHVSDLVYFEESSKQRNEIITIRKEYGKIIASVAHYFYFDDIQQCELYEHSLMDEKFAILGDAFQEEAQCVQGIVYSDANTERVAFLNRIENRLLELPQEIDKLLF